MLLIKNARVWLDKEHTIDNCDILCDGAIIKKVCPDITDTAETVIDAGGRNVYPGFVLGLCAIGAFSFAESARDMNETANPLVPEVDIRDSYDLMEVKRQRFGRMGITSYGLSPGSHALIAGQMSLVHVDGDHTSDVFLRNKMALKGNFTEIVKQSYKGKGAPMTRMAMYQMLDEAFRAAAEYRDKEDKIYDAGKEVLCRVLNREIPFVINAFTPGETDSVLQLSEKYRIKTVIAGGFGIQEYGDALISGGYPVITGDPSSMSYALKSGTDLKKVLELYRSGLCLALGCNGDEGYISGYEQLLWVASMFSAAGATGDELIEMMTINPARALGVDDIIGSIAPGKQADFFICRGNPTVRYDNFIDDTFVAGRRFYHRKED